MKPSEDLFNMFRERQDEWDEVPAAASWKKLERRLDHHQRRTRLSFRRNLSFVAAIAVLVSFVFLISYSMGQRNLNSPQATNLLSTAEIEEFTAEEGDPSALKVVAFSRKNLDHPSLYIREGERKQKLLVKN